VRKVVAIQGGLMGRTTVRRLQLFGNCRRRIKMALKSQMRLVMETVSALPLGVSQKPVNMSGSRIFRMASGNFS